MKRKNKQLRKTILDTERLIETKDALTCLCYREDAENGVCCRSTDEEVKRAFASLLAQLGYVQTDPPEGRDFPIFIVPIAKLNGNASGRFGGANAMTFRCFLSRHGLTRLSDIDEIEDLLIIDQLVANKNLQNAEDLMERIRTLLKI